jgi:hypothetical protein
MLGEAIRLFWSTRTAQRATQGRGTGRRDYGSRGAVTGGAQLNGFLRLVSRLVAQAGLPEAAVHCRRGTTHLPGFFRANKAWDLLVVNGGKLLACIEFKSQVGSFGNNFNNRTEEAIGSATDLWTAYREGAFGDSPRPWLGYFMLLEEAKASTTSVRVYEPHFSVFEEFRATSYVDRYMLLCRRLVRERLYDAACFLLSDRARGREGGYREPSADLNFASFVASLTAYVGAFADLVAGE